MKTKTTQPEQPINYSPEDAIKIKQSGFLKRGGHSLAFLAFTSMLYINSNITFPKEPESNPKSNPTQIEEEWRDYSKKLSRANTSLVGTVMGGSLVTIFGGGIGLIGDRRKRKIKDKYKIKK